MEIVFKSYDSVYTLDLSKNIIIFGQNNNLKNNFISSLADSFIKKTNNLLIDGNKVDFDDYNIIFIDEDNDLANEFKFTKGNVLKKLIYDDIIKKINEEKIINYANEIFDSIDEKINALLDKRINKKSDTNLSFQIEIPDVSSIIDKFTNIYIDNILLSSKDISKSMKRKLLYQLYFLDIKNNLDKINVVIINNFDVYLNSNEIIDFLNHVNSLSNEKCHFILTTSSNIFEYISLDKFMTYKYFNKLLSLNVLDNAIKNYIIKSNYISSSNVSFEAYYLNNESLVTTDEILVIRNMILNKYPSLLGKVLNSINLKVCLEKPKNINQDYIICENKNIKLLFEEICSFFVD